MQKLIGLSLLILVNANLYSYVNTFQANKNEETQFAKIIGSPYEELNGKIASIEGTTKEILGIEDIFMSRGALISPAAMKYAMLNPPMRGKVYYVTVDLISYFLHESWLEKIAMPEKSMTQISAENS